MAKKVSEEKKEEWDDSFIEEKSDPVDPNLDPDEYLEKYIPSMVEAEQELEQDIDDAWDSAIDGIEDKIEGWESQFKEKSYESVLAQGEIFPSLYPRLNAVYNVKLLTGPKEIKTKFGVGYVVEVEYNGLHMSLYCSNSFLFNLAVQKRLKQLTNIGLVGRDIVFQKTEQMIKREGKTQKANITVVQIK